MNGKVPHLAIWSMWLALPLNAFNYWRVWDRLPQPMAVHFNAAWQADGWTDKENSWIPSLGIIVFLLIVFTVTSYAVRAVGKPVLVAWLLLGGFYLTIGFVSYIGDRVLKYNLHLQRHSLVVGLGRVLTYKSEIDRYIRHS